MTVRNVLLKNRCSSFRYLVEPVNKKKKKSSAHAQRIKIWLHFHKRNEAKFKKKDLILLSFLMSEE